MILSWIASLSVFTQTISFCIASRREMYKLMSVCFLETILVNSVLSFFNVSIIDLNSFSWFS
uniref:Uncharacterized protein n=1 Tax=Helianthus annuus TaxID=4232 RepID=A0A251SZT1_HELAN